ncbi:MAG: antibiotic transport system ATP-binding protein [Bacteroidetes bacterium]|nr:MAG: antibiotic transport system ATP-binding protein [Bacteroidota bacterium]
MFSIETSGLTHRFSAKETVLDNIGMQVPRGSIYGFLGPNGAGKTTTLKLILGLLKKQQGDIRVLGKPLEKNRVELLKQVGSLIETPSLYGQLTATENLLVWQKVYGSPKSRIPEVLGLVGLSGTGKKKAGQFSLGMKQRLSIAVALLHEPALLILDEPTNGLDPNGILEIREMLRRLNSERGITILVSSHLLSEIEKLVTHVGIINKGRMVFQGTLDELMKKQQQSSFIVFETSDNTKTLRIATAGDMPSCIENDRVLVNMVSREKIALINRQLVEQGIDVYGISAIHNDLETIFLNLTNT